MGIKNPVNNKGGKKQTEIKVGRSLPLHIFFLCSYVNYIIVMLLLVSCSSTHNHLLYFVRVCAGSSPKIATKNIQQRTL